MPAGPRGPPGAQGSAGYPDDEALRLKMNELILARRRWGGLVRQPPSKNGAWSIKLPTLISLR
ncbi:MAG: hypothetical protein ABL974_08245, partial [Prosthecobacter sp.]